ncbi:MAG: F0F1 ATP synthase subunit delta [Lachnospiraceae bacterium]|nr:F0F1 ATP synthase subunit delta [Lachnospiraceae bacterium]
MAKLVSKTYGEALFELATEQNKSTQLMEEIEALRRVLVQNPDLDKLMKHPGIPKQEKGGILNNIFKGRISDELAGFLQLVVAKERYGELDAIFDYFIDRVKEENGIGVAYVTTAVELADAQKKAVLDKLLNTTSYRTMEMHYDVDASLIGGMKIRVGDRVVDSSIQSKLEALTKQLLQIQLG